MDIKSVKILDSIPAKANPFNYDAFHMGTKIGSNLIIMHPNHFHDECPYIIICNTTTGERMKVILNEESASSSTRLANLINTILPVVNPVLEKGTVLVAINPCIMRDNGKAALTVGKKYTIVHDERDGEIAVKDDENATHWFVIDELSKFFELQ